MESTQYDGHIYHLFTYMYTVTGISRDKSWPIFLGKSQQIGQYLSRSLYMMDIFYTYDIYLKNIRNNLASLQTQHVDPYPRVTIHNRLSSRSDERR